MVDKLHKLKEGLEEKTVLGELLVEAWGVRISRKFWSWPMGTPKLQPKAIVSNLDILSWKTRMKKVCNFDSLSSKARLANVFMGNCSRKPGEQEYQIKLWVEQQSSTSRRGLAGVLAESRAGVGSVSRGTPGLQEYRIKLGKEHRNR